MFTEQNYTVNMGFFGDDGRIYSSGQTLTQEEYNLLPMNQKVRCSPKQDLDFNSESFDFYKPKI